MWDVVACLTSGSSAPGLSPGRDCCVFGQVTLLSQYLSQPWVWMGTRKLLGQPDKNRGRGGVTSDGLASQPGEAILSKAMLKYEWVTLLMNIFIQLWQLLLYTYLLFIYIVINFAEANTTTFSAWEKKRTSDKKKGDNMNLFYSKIYFLRQYKK